MSLRAQLLCAWLRRVEKPRFQRAATAEVLRHRMNLNARLFFHAPRGTQMQWHVFEQGQRRIEMLDIVPAHLDRADVIFYIHGGAFVFGSPRTHAAMLATLGRKLGMRAVLPRYRLAPEHPFPAAFDDVRAGWDALCASGTDPSRIVIGGDSAGGALALSLCQQLLRDGAPSPAGVFCFSPLTDLTYTGESFVHNAAREAVLAADRAEDLARMYLGDHPREDPRASPLFGQFDGAPPVWMTVAQSEILRDDTRRMAHKLNNAGVDVTCHEPPDLPHVWPLFHNMLPEARETLAQLSTWITARLPRQADS